MGQLVSRILSRQGAYSESHVFANESATEPVGVSGAVPRHSLSPVSGYFAFLIHGGLNAKEQQFSGVENAIEAVIKVLPGR
jgi:hypothetical protein